MRRWQKPISSGTLKPPHTNAAGGECSGVQYSSDGAVVYSDGGGDAVERCPEVLAVLSCGTYYLVPLKDVSIVADPAYDAATVSVRSFAGHSFARQFDASEDDVIRDFHNGELRRYFDNRQPVYVDMGSNDLDIRRRRNANWATKIKLDDGRGPDEPPTLDERILRHRMRRNQWDAPIEARSEPWHPGCA